jgi:hypothetical protein
MPDDDVNDAALVARFSCIPDAINADAGLRRRGAFLTVDMLVHRFHDGDPCIGIPSVTVRRIGL